VPGSGATIGVVPDVRQQSVPGTQTAGAGPQPPSPTAQLIGWEQLPGLNGEPLDGEQLSGKVVLVVNVASKCGLTPQYEGLERLQRAYGPRGFTVLGVPCNQFAGQEPGAPEEIEEFCRQTYGTTFPMTAKLEVNGRRRHPLFERLAETPDEDGAAGEIEWNFEKFLVSPSGEVLARFRPAVAPEDELLVQMIEQALRDEHDQGN
jgi:glutathione peroxidase